MNLSSDHPFTSMADLDISCKSSAAASESPAAEASRNKPRGRPQGSKNRPKPPVVIIQESESSMRPLILHLSHGCDLVEAVAAFARRNRTGLSVLSGSGAVANVTLRHPASMSASLILHGVYDILSLAGTFLFTGPPPASSSSSATTLFLQKFPLIISLAGAEGQVVGGEVVGPLLTAGPVVLVAASFINPSFCRIPGGDTVSDQDEVLHGFEQTPKLAGVSGGAGADLCNVVSSRNASGVSHHPAVFHEPNPLTFQLPQIRLPYRSHG